MLKQLKTNRLAQVLLAGVLLATCFACCAVTGALSLIASPSGQPEQRIEVAAAPAETVVEPTAAPTETPLPTDTPAPTPTATAVVPPTEMPAATQVAPTAEMIVPSPAFTPLPQVAETEGEAQALSSEVESYFQVVSEKSLEIGEALGTLGDLLQNPETTDEWAINVAMQAAIIRTAHQTLDETTAPAEMSEIHAAVLAATADCSQSMDFLLQGLDNVNLSDIETASDLMLSCVNKLDTPEQLIEDYMAGHAE